MGEQSDQTQDRDEQGGQSSSGSALNRGEGSAGESPPVGSTVPGEEDRRENTEEGNRESGSGGAPGHGSGDDGDEASRQGDVAREGDLDTKDVPAPGES